MYQAETLPKMRKEVIEIESIRETLERMPEWLSLQEVAKLFRVSYMTVYRAVMCGELDAVMVRGVWRVSRDALRRYLQERHCLNVD